jgi:hypothetical protein
MSNRFKKIKAKKIKVFKPRYQEEATYVTKYKSFNIFTKDGQNSMEVKAPRPMTLDEAMAYFDALCISGNE